MGLRGMGREPDAPLDDEEPQEGFSLEDLGAAFARAAAEHAPDAFRAPGDDDNQRRSEHESTPADASEAETGFDDEEDPAKGPVTPEAIVEAALFVGHPENKPFTEQRLASLMRDVTPDEVVAVISQLNESYAAAGQAFRIVHDEAGYRMSVVPELEAMRNAFLGKVRETRLSQLAVDVLSLVAYQPGITAQTVRDQRGRDCGSVLNQLVRRKLVEIHREKPPEGGRPVARYYPTERFLDLFGLESLEDLPQVEQANLPVD